MKKIILFNGPPSSGKDYAANYLVNRYKYVQMNKFAKVLKERTHALYGFDWRLHDYYEDCKNKPNIDFYDLSPRQAYINVSETYFKPIHGKDIFGKILAQELDKYDWNITVISDSGFIEEALVLIDKYGEHNIALIRIHRSGFSFEGDSRNYIELGSNVFSTDITNHGDNSFLIDLDIVFKQIIML